MSRPAPTLEQARAADPAHSVWVTANAGTGKTRVLADRVLRLLLDRAAAEGILCLTFTRAAAVEMTERIEAELASWAVADDDELMESLTRLEGREPGPERMSWARGLFTTVLDLPRGLPIMTIHAFCASLLRRFPLEAGIPPHFEQIDERSSAELMTEARAWLLTQARDADEMLGQALDRLIALMAESTLAGLLGELVGRRRILAAALGRYGTLDGVEKAIIDHLGAAPNLDARELEARAATGSDIDIAALRAAALALIDSEGKKDVEKGNWIANWLALDPADRQAALASYRQAFVTQKGTPLKSVCNRSFAKRYPEHERTLVREQARLIQLEEQIKARLAAERSAALIRVGTALIERYEWLKTQASVLDYDDLIDKSADLLATSKERQWVLFKLDERLSHLLVDEAQDTSPAQWRIVKHLVEEFAAGRGQHDEHRTLFVVGDEKQSIYSFQGADLDSFRKVRNWIFDRLKPREEELARSFRSSGAVLTLVDALAADPVMARSLGSDPDHDGQVIQHSTSREQDRGEVVVLPLMPAGEREQAPEPWALPSARDFEPTAEERLAWHLADALEQRLADPTPLPATERRAQARDVLVLVSRRGRIQELIIRALKHRGIAVAGADRMSLTRHIAVQDLIALGQALLLPEDDLNFACLLKSPLIGLDEDALFTLAHGRGDRSLAERLKEHAKRAPFDLAWQRLERWRSRADFVPPFELYCEILDDGGRERIVARLGPDAVEPVEAFLAQALAFEEGHPSTLQGFLHWLMADDSQLKRDPEPARDEVRVMTVHGAKGLEAPIVLLADTARGGERGNKERTVTDPVHELLFWRGAEPERPPEVQECVEADKARQEAERARLLYVALTRAKDELWIAGWCNKNSTQATIDASWYGAIGQALDQLDGVVTMPAEGFGEGASMRRLVLGNRQPPAFEAKGEPPGEVPLPDWLGPAPVEAKPRIIRNPAIHPEEDPVVASPRRFGGAGRFFGAELHRLLHRLADLPKSERADALSRAMERLRRQMDEAALTELARQVRGVLDDPLLAPVFAPGSRAEQPIIGRIGDVVVSGQIDRMLVQGGRVLIVDFKSDRRPPHGPEEIPRPYLRQLGAYCSVLDRIYPDHSISCGLVWTMLPRLQLVPGAVLEAYRLS